MGSAGQGSQKPHSVLASSSADRHWRGDIVAHRGDATPAMWMGESRTRNCAERFASSIACWSRATRADERGLGRRPATIIALLARVCG